MSVPLIFCTGLSALMGALSFVASDQLWWLAFIFLIPLFFRVAVLLPRSPWQEGLIWGLLFFSIHSSWLFFLMWYKTDCVFLGFFLALLFVVYCALYGALWFGVSALVCRLHNNPTLHVLAWSISGLLMFYWLERHALWITGQADGYPLVNPLVPLAVKPSLLMLLPSWGSYGLLAALFTAAAATALLFYTAKIGYVFLAMVSLLPFLYGYWQWQSVSIPAFCKNIGYLGPTNASAGPYAQAQAIAESLLAVHTAHPEIKVFVMPESTLGFALNDYPRFLLMWDSALLHKPITIILGAHFHEGNCWYNTLYAIKQGAIIATHKKTHCIPFVEYLPFPWSLLKPLYALFLGDCYSFTRCSHEQTAIPLMDECSMVPYICSELYFSNAAPASHADDPLLCLVNDSWFVAYARHLLFLVARMKAMAWRRNLLYVGHYCAYCFTPAGNGK